MQLDLDATPLKKENEKTYSEKIFAMFPGLQVLDNLDKDGKEFQYDVDEYSDESDEEDEELSGDEEGEEGLNEDEGDYEAEEDDEEGEEEGEEEEEDDDEDGKGLSDDE